MSYQPKCKAMEKLMIADFEPSRDCPLCPRLVAFRNDLRNEHPTWFNAPVPVFGDPNAWLAIVGLAPGMHGANRTGRPFTGDFAGILLYETLIKFGLAHGTYDARPDDGVELDGAVIVNAVRCLPPQNKPTTLETTTCRPFLEAPLANLPNLRVIIALGQIAHNSLIKTMGMRQSAAKFSHGATHLLPSGTRLVDSYHCSRYNQNTRVLTTEMFENVFAIAKGLKE